MSAMASCVQCHQAVPYAEAQYLMRRGRVLAGPFCAEHPATPGDEQERT